MKYELNTDDIEEVMHRLNDRDIEEVDDIVHDMMSEQAAALNNQGLYDQVDYLVGHCDFTWEDFARHLKLDENADDD